MSKFFILIASLFVMNAVQAQVQPSSEHAQLSELVGDWDVSIDMEGQTMKGDCKYKMEHGGLWLTSALEMDMGGMKFTGQGLDSYDSTKKKYVGIWIDSMSTSPIMLEGDRSKDGKTLTMTGKGPDPTGKIVDYKTETEFASKDKHIFKMWMGQTSGKESMKATYVRKVKK